MYSSSFILGFCLVVGLVQATAYNLVDDYTSDGNFFDLFDFYTGTDPTDGWVDYLTYANASDCGLIRSTNPPSWGVDNNNVINPDISAGRPSVRLTSQKTYNHGLFILDLAHMPYSACGVWPAFWSFSQTATWPVGGEIDIIEYVNRHSTDLMTLHTSDGCTINSDSSLMTGEIVSDVCDVSEGSGCSVNNTNKHSAGTGFDKDDGGVYAMEWTSTLIQIWFFPSDSVPSSITDGSPDTSDFGVPQALFEGSGCNIDDHFYDHAIVFDLTFCGAWAGETFEADGCPMITGDAASSCIAYVGDNPAAFDYSYWSVNSLKVYSQSSLDARSTPEAESSTSDLLASPSTASSVLAAETEAPSGSSGHPHHVHHHASRHAHHGRRWW